MHTSTVKINVNRPRSWRRWLVYSDGYLVASVARNCRIINPCTVRSWSSAVGIENGVFGPENREINRTTRGVGYIIIVELNKFRVQLRKNRRMNGVESFMRRHFAV